MCTKVTTSTCGMTSHDMAGDAVATASVRPTCTRPSGTGSCLPASGPAAPGKYLLRCVDVGAWIDATAEPSVAEICRSVTLRA